MPYLIRENLPFNDQVLAFDRIMEEIGIEKYLKSGTRNRMGRPEYDRVNMLKAVLFGFMEKGYISLRELEDECRVNLRYMYLMNNETPTYHCISDFINNELSDSVEEIFKAVVEYIREVEGIDMDHVYIDGSKFEANANKYSWVWKKGTEKSRYRLYEKITKLLGEINEEIGPFGLKIEINAEYVPEYLEQIREEYVRITGIDTNSFVNGRGHHKTVAQRHCEELLKYTTKLKEYIEKLDICGPDRNSYSKTDHGATFMRVKKDYMGNDQLLPAYNVQIGIADEYIVVAEVYQHRSDMDCFIPLMEKYHSLYEIYPKYPVADAGYGSYNNYLFCEMHGMEKYMKFPMYNKETTDENYHNDPFRAVNFQRDAEGNLVCPNGRIFHLAYRKPVRGNKYGREEEIYQCEDCSECPYAERCKKSKENRTIRINQELTSMHQEVIDNLESIHGALLRTNRSIQAEGTFGIIKYDRWYKRTVRRGLKSVRLELNLISIGYDLYKFYNKMLRAVEMRKSA